MLSVYAGLPRTTGRSLVSSCVVIRYYARDERSEMVRQLNAKQKQADRERLLGVKKEEKIAEGRKVIDKKTFESYMMPIVKKHLQERVDQRKKAEDPDWEPIPQEWTDDELEYMKFMKPDDSAEVALTQTKDENDDEFWERRELQKLPRYDYLTASLRRGSKPGRDYKVIAEKIQREVFGDPDKIPHYMRYPDQPKELFSDEKRGLLQPTKFEDIQAHELAIKTEDARDGRDYANNIQHMYNRVQKFKAQRALELEAMGVKPPEPPVPDSKFQGKFNICAAVILERYPTLTPDPKPHELEHEAWQQSIRLRTCKPVIPWYIWKMQWERLTEVNAKVVQKKKGQSLAAKEQQKKPKEERVANTKKGGSSGFKKDTKSHIEVVTAGPPDWGFPKITLPELSAEEANEQQQIDARKLKPYDDWIEFWKKWEAAPRKTEDDINDNRKSINRELDKKLYLIVKRKGEVTWQFPTTLLQDQETIRKSAERAVKESIGKRLTVYFHSNAPVGFYNSFYPTANDQDKYQAESDKIFYMRARYFDGTPDPLRRFGYVDYLWATREQLAEYLPKEYHDRVINFIWPDPNC